MSDVSKQQDWTNPVAMAIREWLNVKARGARTAS